MKNRILINALGISDSGGITVLEKALLECQKNNSYTYYVLSFSNKNILELLTKFDSIENINFKLIDDFGIFYRLCYENLYLPFFYKKHNITLVYNFSGSNQFFSNIPTLVKVQNLMFYSKKLDDEYKKRYSIKVWLKQIFLKRLLFLFMLRRSRYIEVQSIHVQDALSEFLNIKEKKFFLKNDFSIDSIFFKDVKKYNLSKKMIFLYIVGPHFESPHKNIKDFTHAMRLLKDSGQEFEIKITLDYNSLNESSQWDAKLNEYTTFLGYLKDKNEIKKYFVDNTILLSTSIIETLGLHVIEAVQNGILAIVPDEPYSCEVYGDDILKYELFSSQSLMSKILAINVMSERKIQENITHIQKYMIKNETQKYKSITNIFDLLLKGDKNV